MKKIFAALTVILAATAASAQTEITKIGMIQLDREYTIKSVYTPETARMTSFKTTHYSEERDEDFYPERCTTTYNFILGRINIQVYANEKLVGEIQNRSLNATASKETKMNEDHTCDDHIEASAKAELHASVSDGEALQITFKNGNGDTILSSFTYLGQPSIVKLGSIGDVVSSTDYKMEKIRATVDVDNNHSFRTTELYSPAEWKEELARRVRAYDNWNEKD